MPISPVKSMRCSIHVATVASNSDDIFNPGLLKFAYFQYFIRGIFIVTGHRGFVTLQRMINSSG